ncbi:ferritin-like domain-containing protein [Paracoccus sp. (in: a-proteobacteria)]|uniref:ferritin-like domain-containing protein n=1 Tax=Paracoccus sp. TaxID=267 RepID=UPI0027296176|nr:ferritin-like domain-containing protein [Paracoccus sp. (in: a-proteobacteria)]
MATTVGTEDTIRDLVTNLILLERDAIAAYETTISRLTDPALSSQIESFRQDHLQHLDVLTQIAAETGADAPQEGDMKQMLTTGKVALAGLLGDASILKAMRSNEEDTVTAYQRASEHPDALPQSLAFFRKALADECRHRDWMEQTADSL